MEGESLRRCLTGPQIRGSIALPERPDRPSNISGRGQIRDSPLTDVSAPPAPSATVPAGHQHRWKGVSQRTRYASPGSRCGHSGRKPRAGLEPIRTGRGPSPSKVRAVTAEVPRSRTDLNESGYPHMELRIALGTRRGAVPAYKSLASTISIMRTYLGLEGAQLIALAFGSATRLEPVNENLAPVSAAPAT